MTISAGRVNRMTVKINGKDFDFDSDQLYEGERPARSKFIMDVVLLAVIGIWSYAAYPWMVYGIKLFFKPLLHYFGIRG